MGKGRRFQMLFGLGAGLLVAGCAVTSLVGCSNGPTSGSTRPSASELKEGLTLLDAKDAKWGLNAAYVKDGRVVYIESRVGGLKPEVYRNDSPEEPQNEMDLRFVDKDNHTFFAQRGGDSWVDPTWGPEISKALTAIPETEADWAVAHEAAAALPKALDASFKDHNFHLGVFTTMPSPANDPVAKARLTEGAKMAPPEALAAYGTYSNGGYNELYYGKYSKATGCFFWVCGGSHTAIGMYANPNIGAWVTEINSCNHGTCPGAMGYDCYGWNGGGWFYGVSLTGASPTGTDGANDGQGGCQTAYAWNTGGNNHLCNDDAVYEMWQVDHGNTGAGPSNSAGAAGFTYNTNGSCRGSLCASGSPAHYACSCQQNSGCSGDWNTPNCF